MLGKLLDMTAPGARRLRQLAAILLLCVGGITLLLKGFAPSSSLVIVPADVRLDEGRAFVVAISPPLSRLYALVGDDAASPRASTLVLLEDGRVAGPAHAPHAAIRSTGRGRYSHWGGDLWFSSSDDTDPRSNGRVYSIEYQSSLKPGWYAFGLASLVLGFSLLSAGSARGRPGAVKPSFVGRFFNATTQPRTAGRTLILVVAGGAAVLGVGSVVAGWYWGDTSLSGLAVARYLPVSDAFGYHSCATAIGLTGSFDQPFGGGWCSRRALYPAMLASVLALSGWHSQIALLVQGLMVGVSIAGFVLQLRTRCGLLAGLAASALLALYAWQFVLGLFMTEVAGFVLGLGGLGLLMRHAETGQRWGIGVGAALLSIGLTARAGVLFALPALVMWSVFAFNTGSTKGRMMTALACAAGIVVGPLLQFAFVWLLGADPWHSGGNFAVSLYGLSTGSRDWSEAYRALDHLFQLNEAEAFREAYRLAFANILARPGVFAGALLMAARAYFDALFLFDEFFLRGTSALHLLVDVGLVWLVGVGLVWCVVNFRRPFASLLMALALAELAAAPLIFDSGGNRVFAATVGVRVALVAVGLQWVLEGIAIWTVGGSARNHFAPAARTFDLNLVVPCMAVALMLFAISSVPRWFSPPMTDARTCDGGLSAVVSHVGAEAQAVQIVQADRALVAIWPYRIAPARIREDRRIHETWFGDDFLALKAPTTIIRAVDLQQGRYGTIYPLIVHGSLDATTTPRVFCFDSNSSVELAGVRHFVVKDVRPLSSP